MDAVGEGREHSSQPGGSGCTKTVVGVGLGLALGALAGLVLGLAAGVAIAMIVGVI